MNLIYYILHRLVKITLPLYYRRVNVSGTKNLPLDKPVLLAVNHQNAFLDAVLVVYQMNKQAYFLARSDAFKNPIVGKILKGLNIVPIYRAQDGTGVKNNGEVFTWCYQTLAENKWVLIFPEGTCEPHKHMFPLKKGMARIALGAVEKYPNLDLHIVPVGLNYSDHMGFRSDVWIDYGEPISVQKVAREYSGSGDRINVLTALVEAELRTMVLHLEKEGYEESDKTMRRNIAALEPLSGKHLVEIEKSKLNSERAPKRKFQWINDALSFPLLLVHRPLYFLIDKLAEKLTGRDEFFPSVKYGFCTLFFPVYWMVLSFVVVQALSLPWLAAFAVWVVFPVSLWAGLKVKKV
ncbi:MAG: lysophospholipid acyltransferase family protein [Bacteroidetes bacterium]|nr:lysophospholipid acyltransferase family protein [Bacteroidota bacterium]